MAHNTTNRLAQAAFYLALAAAILGAIALPALAAEPRALLTIADGKVQVLRGGSRFDAGEGLALADDDIVRTAPSTRVARIEFADGRTLDLGPATQVLLLSPRMAQAQGWAGATALAVQGWAKLSAGDAASRLVLPQAVAAGDARGVLLAHVAPDGATLAFAESRGVTLLPRGAGGADVLLREGETWVRDAASAEVRVSSRPTGLRDMPRALVDTLPRRAASFVGRASEAADGTPIDAADLAAWSRAEPQLLAQLRPSRGVSVRRAGSTTARRSDAVKWARHDRDAARPVARRSARVLPVPLVAAAPLGAAAVSALPATVFLTAEPIATVNLPAVPSPVQAR